MSGPLEPSSPLRTWLCLAAVALAAAMVIAALGYYPSRHWAGPAGPPAMLAGCAVALVASWIGSLPLALMRPKPGASGYAASAAGRGAAAVNRILAASALRLAVVLALSLSVALSGWFPRNVLLVSVAVAYVGMLLVETVYLVWSRESPASETAK